MLITEEKNNLTNLELNYDFALNRVSSQDQLLCFCFRRKYHLNRTNQLTKICICRNLVTSKKDAQKVNCNRNEDFERNVSPPETCKQDLDCPETGKDHASHPIQAAKHEVVNNILYEGTIKKTVKNEIYHTFDSK